jgi:hypothetical protein
MLRVMVIVAGITGLLALFGGHATWIMQNQHCEPLRRLR